MRERAPAGVPARVRELGRYAQKPYKLLECAVLHDQAQGYAMVQGALRTQHRGLQRRVQARVQEHVQKRVAHTAPARNPP